MGLFAGDNRRRRRRDRENRNQLDNRDVDNDNSVENFLDNLQSDKPNDFDIEQEKKDMDNKNGRLLNPNEFRGNRWTRIENPPPVYDEKYGLGMATFSRVDNSTNNKFLAVAKLNVLSDDINNVIKTNKIRQFIRGAIGLSIPPLAVFHFPLDKIKRQLDEERNRSFQSVTSNNNNNDNFEEEDEDENVDLNNNNKNKVKKNSIIITLLTSEGVQDNISWDIFRSRKTQRNAGFDSDKIESLSEAKNLLTKEYPKVWSVLIGPPKSDNSNFSNLSSIRTHLKHHFGKNYRIVMPDKLNKKFKSSDQLRNHVVKKFMKGDYYVTYS